MKGLLVEANNLSKIYKTGSANHNSSSITALHEVTFQINSGDSLGIIGKNGSGKSTLLGILSGLIKPTSGSVKLYGKVASILDIGFGFHPDLTGRENVFFFGKMLGLANNTINARFEEMVAFSELEDFIELPVKKYSNGMYLRLAASVALYSDCDIMIIDEVISVGDGEFRQKVAAKLLDMRKNGLTLIVASHSMNEVLQICNKCLVFEKGNTLAFGDTFDCVQRYLNSINHQTEPIVAGGLSGQLAWTWDDKDAAPGNETVKIRSVIITSVNHKKNDERLYIEDDINIEVEFWKDSAEMDIQLLLLIYDTLGNPILYSVSFYSDKNGVSFINLFKDQTGLFKMRCTIPKNFLNHGTYRLQLRFGGGTTEEIYIHDKLFQFDIHENKSIEYYNIRDFNVPLRPQFAWDYVKLPG